MSIFIKIKKFVYSEEIRRYIVAGVLTTIIGYLVYGILLSTFLDSNKPLELQLANAFSWIAGITFSFITSKKYVFQDVDHKLLLKGIKFYTSRIAVMLIEGIQLYIYVSIFELNDKVMKICASFVSVILNYCFSKFLVFKKTE